MGYIIANLGQRIFLKLDKNGKAETCPRHEAQTFTYVKACNILGSIPRTLQKFNFSVVEEQEIGGQDLSNLNYELSPLVARWAERVKSCDDLKKDAQKRKEELLHELSNADKELSNILHTIEIDRWKNGCDGYKCYKESKSVLEKRRPIKDELIVVRAILDSNLNNLSEQRINQIINGLRERRFEYRDTDN